MNPCEAEDDPYLCVGVCMADPDSGYCLGCGRPPLATPTVVAEPVPATSAPPAASPPATADSGAPDTLEGGV